MRILFVSKFGAVAAGDRPEAVGLYSVSGQIRWPPTESLSHDGIGLSRHEKAVFIEAGSLKTAEIKRRFI